MRRLLLVALSAAPAAAATRAHYVDARDLESVRGFPLPVGLGSEADAADLAEVKRLQEGRAPADCARARGAETPSYQNLYGALSPFPKPLPKRARLLFSRAAADAAVAVMLLKARQDRPRPFMRDPSIKPCVARPGSSAFPSGHAAQGRLFALILSDLVPSRSAEFLARGDEIGLDRVIGGVHSPAEVEGGARLADRLHERMRRSQAYRADLEAARSELREPQP